MARPEDVDRRVLRRYLVRLDADRFARRTIARKASVLRRYFDWLRRAGRIERDPTRGLSAPRGEARLPRILSSDELDVLLSGQSVRSAADDEARSARDTAVIELLYGSGLRVSELCGLTAGSIDLNRRRVTVIGKGDKERVVPLSEPATAGAGHLVDPAGNGPHQARRGARPVPQPAGRAADPSGCPPDTGPSFGGSDASSCTTTHLRDSSFGWRCRSSCCARASGSRGFEYDTGLYPREPRAFTAGTS